MKEYYENPLIERYASKEMLTNFSPQKKFETWRKLWIALAEAEKELGLPITREQIDEMKSHVSDINFDDAEEFEKNTRHDVMAHVLAFGKQCPKAKPIIHLGATSAFVGDNTDIILMKDGLGIIKRKLINVINNLKDFALKYKDLPTLGFTHFQPAQLTTVGKRACLWIQDLATDLGDLEYQEQNLMLRGVKGTTGTQASFMKLFDNDEEKVKKLDSLVAAKMGFERTFPITGQTYPRKLDSRVLQVLQSIAESAHKFAVDIRLLASLKEIEEPFEEKQIGSSAMAYKRNPMRCERITALSRYVIVNGLNPYITASNQWFERTLDDSANRRIVIPECFLAVDSILNIYMNVSRGLVVNSKVIEKHIFEELPFMATENILMEAVKRGGDRQELHEVIRMYSLEASRDVKQGGDNKLIEKIIKDGRFRLNEMEIRQMLKPENFIGRSSNQVVDYISQFIDPILEKYKNILGETAYLKV
ncbi:adenylosuccinate lyase [Biomaibacter acetigenes]|uniref:Adenylosuccinate lyase n=1 Tax=Biomaibacter acetigenes TaxID=2316383 RepID=A0A3G2R579_9FIRM|nr:adenylosuccinate lyase [Biomaibacter acetigenes]AYO30562.1 adenylosuccinate lyase [Biomaibacter acetigenes]MDN5301984.1 adenylosuccinate lyase [Thermoanaerobacteraceae bacterium]